MTENKKKLQVLTLLTEKELEPLEDSDCDNSSGDENGEVQAVKVPLPPPPPVKKPRTEKQIAVFARAKLAAKTNAENRRIVADLLAKEQQKVYEEKIVQKAIAIKKREVKKHAGLDKIPDDDTPLQEIAAIVKKGLPAKPEPAKFTFV